MFTFNVLVYTMVAMSVFAQQNVGQCMLSCATNMPSSIFTTCNTTEWSCLCSERRYVEDLRSCVKQNCNSTELDVLLVMISGMCGSDTSPSTAALPTSYASASLGANSGATPGTTGTAASTLCTTKTFPSSSHLQSSTTPSPSFTASKSSSASPPTTTTADIPQPQSSTKTSQPISSTSGAGQQGDSKSIWLLMTLAVVLTTTILG